MVPARHQEVALELAVIPSAGSMPSALVVFRSRILAFQPKQFEGSVAERLGEWC